MAKLTNAQSTLLVIKSKIPFFDDFTNAEVIELTKEVTFVKYNQGETVFEQNTGGKDIYFVVQGSVDVLLGKLIKRQGRVQYREHVKLATLEKRSLFGEMSAITGERRSARCVSAKDGTTLLRFKVVKEVSEENKIILAILYYKFIDILSTKLKILNEKVYG